MKTINFGKTEAGEDVNLNFEKEEIRFVMLIAKSSP